jgi:hypothetical protein
MKLLETFDGLLQKWRTVFSQERTFEPVRRLTFGLLTCFAAHLTSTAICASGRQFSRLERGLSHLFGESLGAAPVILCGVGSSAGSAAIAGGRDQTARLSPARWLQTVVSKPVFLVGTDPELDLHHSSTGLHRPVGDRVQSPR